MLRKVVQNAAASVGTVTLSGPVGATNSLKSLNAGEGSKVISLGDDAAIARFNDDVTDEVVFTAATQHLTFNTDATLSGGINFDESKATIALDSTTGNDAPTIIGSDFHCGALSITGGANTVTIASAVGTSATQRLSALTLSSGSNAIFSSEIYKSGMTLEGIISFSDPAASQFFAPDAGDDKADDGSEGSVDDNDISHSDGDFMTSVSAQGISVGDGSVMFGGYVTGAVKIETNAGTINIDSVAAENVLTGALTTTVEEAGTLDVQALGDVAEIA